MRNGKAAIPVKEPATQEETPVLDNLNLRTDFGNAARFLTDYGDVTRYIYARKKFLSFDGQRWNDSQSIVERHAKLIVKSLRNVTGKDAADDKAWYGWYHTSQKPERQNAMLTTARSEIEAKFEDFDQEHDILNVENGIIELKTGNLLLHDPARLCTKIVPITYNKHATCPQWQKFVSEIMQADEGLIKFLQKAVGYSLSGFTREQVFFLLYGIGSNGKSLFLSILKRLLADYGTTAQMVTFTARQQNNGAPTEELARLRGARVVTAIETDEGKKLNEGLIKQITGCDPVTACFKYESFFTFTPVFKLWIAANHRPEISGTDEGIWRRPLLIPFDAQWAVTEEIAKEKKLPLADKQLEEKLLAELPGILNWALEGYRLWESEGLNPPEKVKAAMKTYRQDMDVIQRFIENCCITGKGKTVGATDLFNSYCRWCEENTETRLNQTVFGRRMVDHGYEKKKGTTVNYHGIGLLRPWSSDSSDSSDSFSKNSAEGQKSTQKTSSFPQEEWTDDYERKF